MDSGSCSQMSALWKLDYCQLKNDNVPLKIPWCSSKQPQPSLPLNLTGADKSRLPNESSQVTSP